jgi:hypothetical protein
MRQVMKLWQAGVRVPDERCEVVTGEFVLDQDRLRTGAGTGLANVLSEQGFNLLPPLKHAILVWCHGEQWLVRGVCEERLESEPAVARLFFCEWLVRRA